jgi:hypothetical protein
MLSRLSSPHRRRQRGNRQYAIATRLRLGGKLALAAAPAAVDSVILSDVVGDDPADIAS